MSRLRGMTLIELMIVLAIIGIGITIGVATFRSQLEKGRRSDAREMLLNAAIGQERTRSGQSNAYTADLAALGYPGGLSTNGYYRLEVVAADNETYLLRAVPVAGAGQERDDDCQVFTIDARGRQAAAPDPAGTCWPR
jgi:type IV pilus assembly protein PilE